MVLDVDLPGCGYDRSSRSAWEKGGGQDLAGVGLQNRDVLGWVVGVCWQEGVVARSCRGHYHYGLGAGGHAFDLLPGDGDLPALFAVGECGGCDLGTIPGQVQIACGGGTEFVVCIGDLGANDAEFGQRQLPDGAVGHIDGQEAFRTLAFVCSQETVVGVEVRPGRIQNGARVAGQVGVPDAAAVGEGVAGESAALLGTGCHEHPVPIHRDLLLGWAPGFGDAPDVVSCSRVDHDRIVIGTHERGSRYWPLVLHGFDLAELEQARFSARPLDGAFPGHLAVRVQTGQVTVEVTVAVITLATACGDDGVTVSFGEHAERFMLILGDRTFAAVCAVGVVAAHHILVHAENAAVVGQIHLSGGAPCDRPIIGIDHADRVPLRALVPPAEYVHVPIDGDQLAPGQVRLPLHGGVDGLLARGPRYADADQDQAEHDQPSQSRAAP